MCYPPDYCSAGFLRQSRLTAVLLVATTGMLSTSAVQAGFPGTNGKIAFDKLTGAFTDIYMMNANGSGETPLTTNPASDNSPAWSPDGTRIAFASTRDGNSEIYVMNADGSGQTRLTSNSANDGNPAWTPDGSRIAFHSDRDGNFEIYVMTAAGAGQTRLTFGATSDLEPAWSPDGTLIAYQSSGAGFAQIYTMNANGSNRIPRTNASPAFDSGPSWSPDGTRIAFQRDAAGDAEIFVMNANGSGQTNLSNNPTFDGSPSWSPDGTRIAFASIRAGGFEIYAMNADGSSQTRLTVNAEIDVNPDWQSLPLPGNTAITVSGFEGTSFQDNCALGTAGCFQIPYTMGAVGTSQFVETSTGSIAVYDKTTGALLAPRQPISQFWTGIGAPALGQSNGGQRVLFDHYTSRWVTTATGTGDAPVSASNPGADVFIGVSDTADALGSWKFTRVIGAANGGSGSFADVPTLGMDDQAVYVSTNNFTPTFAADGTGLYSIPKADLFGGAPSTTNMTRFYTVQASPDLALTIQGAVNWGGNPTATPSMLAARATGSDLSFHQLNGVNGAGATRTPSVVIPSAPNFVSSRARQPNGTRVIDTVGGLIVNPVYQANGKLYAVRTVLPAASPDTAVIRWSVHNASTGTLIEEGDIAGEVGFDYYQGSIAANQFGEVVIGYNRSGGTDKGLAGRISFMARTFRTDAGGGLDQFGPEILLRVSSVSDYHCDVRPNSGCLTRWGPTSAVTVDPLAPRRFFAIGQYAADWAIVPGFGTTERAVWHTYIARISFAPDTDGDGFADTADNCTLVSNPSQLDADGDGYGNICDADLNNTGLVTTADFAILRSVLNQSAGSSTNAAIADLNGSGTVTTADFAILRARLNTAPGPSGLAP